MGIIVSIHRSDYDSPLNVFHGKARVTVVNIPGPFEPTDDAPAAILTDNAMGDPIITPVMGEKGVREPLRRPDAIGPMMGGTFAHTSDSRFAEAVGQYGAIAVHDRYETQQTYNALTRD